MFNSVASDNAWNELHRLHKRGEVALMQEKLAQYVPLFRESGDELRVLFFMGVRLDESCYRAMLCYFDHWRETPPPDFEKRTAAYLYALEQSIPPAVAHRRPFMEAEFRKTVGLPPK